MPVIIRTLITPLGTHAGKFTIPLHGVNDSWIPSLQNQGDEWQRLGQNGSGMQIIGTRGRRIQASGWNACATLKTATDFVGLFESLEAEVCQVTDAWNRALPRVRLTAISCMPKATRGPIISGTTATLYRVECQWTAELLPNA